MKLAVVTATTSPSRSYACRSSWADTAIGPVTFYGVINAAGPIYHSTLSQDGRTPWNQWAPASWYCVEPDYLGVVPAFAIGVEKALADGAEIIACFHDDLLIEGTGWDRRVIELFDRSQVGLAGFGGATGLGHPQIYQIPYDPMQLARQDFVSNMRDAEAHGRRGIEAERVVCLDGFSQIGRRGFWEGWYQDGRGRHSSVNPPPHATGLPWNLFGIMQELGFRHHFYDGALGCYAARLGWEAWFLPVRCHHLGGQTAVGDPGYQHWARTQVEDGDQGFWKQAHEIAYREFRTELPLRLSTNG